MESAKKIRMSLSLLKGEIILSNMMFHIAVMNLFWRDYAGMSQVEVSISQAAFMVIMILLDVPMGWLADAFSRKWANVFGDFVLGLGFIVYVFADTLWWVIAAEVVLAIGLSASSGADGPLMEEYCNKLGKNYAREQARLQQWTPLVMAGAMAIGGGIGAINPRLAMLLGALPPLIGGTLMLFVTEDKRAHAHTEKHPVRDIKAVLHYSFRGHKELASTIWAKTVLNSSTHTLVWVTTPVLIASGVPVWLVGMGWAANNVGAAIGGWLASKWGTQMNTKRAFTLPLAVLVGGCLLLGLFPNIITVSMVMVFGAVKGWQIAIMPARVQQLAPDAIKTSVNSVSSTLSRLAYIPLVMLIGWAGTSVPTNALLLNAGIFACLGLLVLPTLHRHA
jgi:MFS transporter, DHA3 family, tetracycline resistance protein